MTATAAPPTGSAGSLLRSSAVMAAGTFLSRILGFVRAAVFAAALGVAVVGDVFTTANTVPNSVYVLLAGGVLNTVLVPQLVRAMKRDEDGGQAYADRLLTLVGVVLLVVTVVATACAPLLVRLFAGSTWSQADLALATAFAFWCLPQIFFYGAYTLISQVLNARGAFGPMTWAPIANNVVAIAGGLLFIAAFSVDGDASASVSTSGTALLGGASTLGVAVQAAVLVPVLRRVGYRYRARWDWRGTGLGAAGRLAVWTLALVAVNQVGYFVVVRTLNGVGAAVSHVPGGEAAGYAVYNQAYLVFLLPHGIVAVSVVTALVPRLAAAAQAARTSDVVRDLSYGLRLIGAATVPAAAAFVALGPWIATVLFARGQVSTEDARHIGLVLSAFGPGLVFFSAQYLVLRGFYALEDTRTPFRLAVCVNAVLVAGTLLAAGVLDSQDVVVAVAATYGLAYVVGLAVSVALLRRRLGGLDAAHVVRTHVRLLLAVLPSALLAHLAARGLDSALDGAPGAWAATAVGALVLGAGYLGMTRLLHVEEVTGLLGSLRGRG